jgi:hypothetical protein
MKRPRWTSFIVLSTVLALLIQLLIISSIVAQAQNTSLAENRSALRIVDLKNNTITILDPETNQPVSVRNLTPAEAANATAFLTPENTTVNETLTTNKGENATTNINLTNKFEELQGK